MVCSGLRVRGFAVIGSWFRGLEFEVSRWGLRVLTVRGFRSVGFEVRGFHSVLVRAFAVRGFGFGVESSGFRVKG